MEVRWALLFSVTPKNMKTLLLALAVHVSMLAIGQEKAVYVHYIDMGQGLATLVQFPNGLVMIDAGSQIKSQRDESREKVKDYLDAFFKKNTGYNNTINTIIVTHNHQDHTGTIPDVYQRYKVINLVTTSFHKGNDVNLPGVKTVLVEYSNIKKNGITNKFIDPIKSANGVDPKITLYSGRNASFTSATETPNNHSIVTKIEYGKASFVFTGDLEEKGIDYLLNVYNNNLNVLSADVYQVGHHGSPNATNAALLDALKPKIAVISASHKEDVSGGSGWDYGHPRDQVVTLLSGKIGRQRSTQIKGHVYRAEETKSYMVDIGKAIYCTCWDGNIIIKATSDGDYTVNTSNH
jgi:competence protein ComEC